MKYETTTNGISIEFNTDSIDKLFDRFRLNYEEFKHKLVEYKENCFNEYVNKIISEIDFYFEKDTKKSKEIDFSFLDKRKINTIYFGGGTYGVNAASKYYFGHDATQITPAEAAILVIQLSNPAFSNWDTILGVPSRKSRLAEG